MAQKNFRGSDLTNKRFGYLVALCRTTSRITKGGNSIAMWECQCDCGNKTVVSAGHLRTLHTKSCGKCGLTGPSHEFEDLTGQKFGYLTVVKRVENHISSGGNSFVTWECRCDCGEKINVTAGHLKSNHTMSCGKCGKFDHSVDFTGKRCGRLVVLEKTDDWYTYPDGDRDFKWLCQCDCGNKVIRRGNTLRNKKFVQSCGCWRTEESVRDEDMLNRDFGSVHVESRAQRISVGSNSTVDAWNCTCKNCGTKFVARGPQLRVGNVVSCGCVALSKWELWLSQFLDEHNILYSTQKYYSDLFGIGGKHLSYDFCLHIDDIDILIECQGIQHYEPVDYFGGKSSFVVQVEHDKRKLEYAIAHDILLIVLDCSKRMTRDEYFSLIRNSFVQYDVLYAYL